MKRFFYILLAGMVLAGCRGQNNPEWTEQYEEAMFYVVQFNSLWSVELPKERVMLVPNSRGEYAMRSLLNGGTCKEFFLGTNPFIQADKRLGWYLADWKWGLLLSKNHVVLRLGWRDVTVPDATYVRSDFEIYGQGILDRIGIVKRSDIDKLLHIEPTPATTEPGSWGRTSGGISTDHLKPVYLSKYYSLKDVPDVIDRKGDWKYTKQDFIAERLRQDSLQEVYRARLEQLLDAGMVNSVVRFVE